MFLSYNSNKLFPRCIECVLLRYVSKQCGFLCLNVTSNKIYISRDFIFHKSPFPFSSASSHYTSTSFSNEDDSTIYFVASTFVPLISFTNPLSQGFEGTISSLSFGLSGSSLS